MRTYVANQVTGTRLVDKSDRAIMWLRLRTSFALPMAIWCVCCIPMKYVLGCFYVLNNPLVILEFQAFKAERGVNLVTCYYIC